MSNQYNNVSTVVDYINQRVELGEPATDILLEINFELDSIWDESGALYYRDEDGVYVFLWEDGWADVHE